MSWWAHTVRKIAGSASCAHLPVVGGMATYRFQKMLRVQWRGTVRHLPTEIDRPATALRIRDGLRYRLHFRKGRSAIGKIKVQDVTTGDVLAVLTPIWTTKAETARRVRQRIGTVMKWAVAQGWRQDNPA